MAHRRAGRRGAAGRAGRLRLVLPDHAALSRQHQRRLPAGRRCDRQPQGRRLCGGTRGHRQPVRRGRPGAGADRRARLPGGPGAARGRRRPGAGRHRQPGRADSPAAGEDRPGRGAGGGGSGGAAVRARRAAALPEAGIDRQRHRPARAADQLQPGAAAGAAGRRHGHGNGRPPAAGRAARAAPRGGGEPAGGPGAVGRRPSSISTTR